MLNILSEPRLRPVDAVHAARGQAPLERREWIRRCTARMVELRPDESPERVARVVGELWRDAPQFHPELAAEMEHECW